jgi:hypothetical protein
MAFEEWAPAGTLLQRLRLRSGLEGGQSHQE